MAAQWETMEDFITDVGQGTWFNSIDVASNFGISGPEASSLIQAYLHVQHRPNSRAQYVIRRKPGTRTSKALWSAGTKVKDAKGVTQQYVDDIKRRLAREIEPDLMAMGLQNSRAMPLVEASVNALVAGIELLAAGVNGNTGP